MTGTPGCAPCGRASGTRLPSGGASIHVHCCSVDITRPIFWSIPVVTSFLTLDRSGRDDTILRRPARWGGPRALGREGVMALVACPIPGRMTASQAGSAAGFLRYAAKPHRHAVSAEPGAQVRVLAGRQLTSSKYETPRLSRTPKRLSHVDVNCTRMLPSGTVCIWWTWATPAPSHL